MFDTLPEIESSLRAQVSAIDPDGLEGSEAVEALDRFDQLERLAAAGRALAASAIERSEAWRRSGQRDAIGFVAARTAGTHRSVRDGIEVASRLGSLPHLDQAVRSGAVSIDQATDIAAAARQHPDTEAELIALAGHASRRRLRARCVEILARGQGAEDQHRRAKTERSASSTVGRDGTWRLNVSLPVADGAVIDKVLDYLQTEIFDEARRRGDREPFAAYRADALVRMAQAVLASDSATSCSAIGGDPAEGGADGTTKRRRGVPRRRSSSLRHAIVITVPHSLFLAKNPANSNGETCQVPGVGPVPVSVVHQLMESDPIIKAVVTEGRDITATATLDRHIKEDLRLAVLMSSEMKCAVATCDNDRFLELDHRADYSKGGPTAYQNLQPLCCFHHDQKTHDGYRLRGRPGSYEWVAPDGTVIAAERSATPV